MTKRATLLLFSSLFAAGTALAQTTSLPSADETRIPNLSGTTEPGPGPSAPEAGEISEAAGATAPAFTPVPIDNPQVPEPIASRAVPPDYSQPEGETEARGEPLDDSPGEPQPTPEVAGVPTEPEQSGISPAAAEALDATSNGAEAGDPASTADAPSNAAPPPDQAAENGESDPDGVATAETPPDDGVDADGTSPGSAGSSGWTGGLGGSMIGTNPAGAVPESTTWQPPTARGLDLGG